MIRIARKFAASLILLSFSGLAVATAPPRKQAPGDPPRQDGVTQVTDGAGHPIPPQAAAGAAKPEAEAADDGRAARTQRGRAWWPYPGQEPPYTDVNRRVESLSEHEVVVNGVVTLDVRNPWAARQKMPAGLRLEAGEQLGRAAGFYLVKIAGFSRSQAHVDALEAAGAVLGELLNVNTYVAKIPSDRFEAVKSLPFVTFVGDYEPAFKLGPRLGRESVAVDEATDAWPVEITLHRGADVDEALDELARLGVFPTTDEVVSNGETTVILAAIEPGRLTALARVPGVKWIAEHGSARLLASSSSPTVIPMLHQNNGVFTTNTSVGWTLWNAGIDGNRSGTSQIVTMMDSGLNTRMEHFAQSTTAVGTIGPSHRKVVGYDVFGGGDECVTSFSNLDGGHGTWTSQHAVGSISNMTTDPDTTHTPTSHFDNGVAPDGKVYFQDIGLSGSISPPLDLLTSILFAIDKGSRIQSHSWGISTPTYDSTASFLDAALFDNPSMVVTVAAGNGGVAGASTIVSPATAKNAIAVGGVDAAHPDSVFQDCLWDGSAACSGAGDLGSARGPVATSGRVKPDILGYMAFDSTIGGESMAGERPGAMCQTDASKPVYWDWVNNVGLGGTSFSAPQVAGLAALVRDYFLSGFYPSGVATPSDAFDPAGPLVKAVILASGESTAATASPTTLAMARRYSNDAGYGRANLPGVLHIGNGAPFLWVQNNDALGDGATRTFFYSINGNDVPLRVMMVYYDDAGNALQKDADLKVTIGSDVYWGNNFSGGWSTTATVVRDHTNPTEGVFLDAAHGLPASGTARVDVLGFSNPGGMSYSLVVVGNVASQDVTQVSLDKGTYTCSDEIRITVNDVSATSPVSVTLTSKNGGGTTIDTATVDCTGSNGAFIGTAVAGTDIAVVHGGSLTASYGPAADAVASVGCRLAVQDGGYLVSGGCDNTAAGTDSVSGPLSNGGSNEFYTRYMDGGEYSSYTAGFVNLTGIQLTDVRVTLSFSGPGASRMTVFNSPVLVGAVPPDALTGAVFQVFTDPATPALTSVNLDLDITSPADGFTTPFRLTQTRLLQANDQVSRQEQCSTFNTSLSPWYESVAPGAVANPWRWVGAASSPSTVGSETRTDGVCDNATANAAAMVGNSGTNTAATNFALNADSFLLQRFQPALRGNAPNGQPYRYVWKWHSFYHASELLANQGGVWGAFYDNQWNSTTDPTAAQAQTFPIAVAYYYHTVFDYVGVWDWESANTGTPDDPHFGSSSGGAPNQLIIGFDSSIRGDATSNTWWAYGHEHIDARRFVGGNPVRRDVALDNDRLVYDEFFGSAQAGASCGGGGQAGQVAFDRYRYGECPAATVVLSVLDANATGPLEVVVTSPGTGDTETVTLTGSAPYFSGPLTIATDAGSADEDGTLFVLPSESITAAYTDGSPAASSTAVALVRCTGGDVVFVSSAQVSDNGDDDGTADNNESVTIDVTIRNDTTAPLTNTRVQLFPASPSVDCISDAEALYGTVAAGATATNPPSDRFTFHVSSAVACADWQAPPTARFYVAITADGIDGASTLQVFTLDLDLDATASGGSYTYSQSFGADPGWLTAATPDDSGTCSPGYVNNFHWCAACGNGNGGYGAWIGDAPFGTPGQNYPVYDSSTLYSPTFIANGNVTMQFSVAYRTEPGFDGALVEYRLGAGAWTDLAFTTPAQAATTGSDFCSPLDVGVTAWTGTGVSWTTTNAASVTAATGTSVQFRWRLGSDETIGGTSYGGLGVDNVVITNLKQTLVCEPTRNTGLPGCPAGGCSGAPNGTPCDDGDACTQTDTCQSDVCVGSSPVVCAAPGECQLAGVCDTGTGVCGYAPRPAGTACGSSTDTQCTDPDTCDGAGTCQPNHAANGTTCDDADGTTCTDVCATGTCTGTPTAEPPEIGATLVLGKSAGDATLGWSGTTGDYNVYRGSRASGAAWTYDHACLANGLAASNTTDGDDPVSSELYYYFISQMNVCRESVLGRSGSGVPVPNDSPCP